MSFLTTQPQLITAAAANVAGLHTALAEANATALGPTTGVVAAAADEVSAAAAELFETFGLEYQQLASQATAFHSQFQQALSTAGIAYTQAEVAGAAAFTGPLAAATPLESLINQIQAFFIPTTSSYTENIVDEVTPWPGNNFEIPSILTGSGTSTPSDSYMTKARAYMNAGFDSLVTNGFANNPVSTNEGLYPFTAIKDLMLTPSVDRGLQELYNAVFGPYGTLSIDDATGEISGRPTSLFGYSQSSIMHSLFMQQLTDSGVVPNPDLLSFTLIGNEMNPNGGLLSRFPGLNVAALGIDFYGATPVDSGYPVYNYTLEYDGFADFPRYPLNILSDVNAFMGIAFVHGTYLDYDPNNLPPGYNLVELPISPETEANYPGLNNYYMITHDELPLLTPLRWLPVIGDPIADLVQPNLRYFVNLGYGDPNYGYSTSYADVPTPFELFPPIPPNFLGDQVTLANEGWNDFTSDVSAIIPSMSQDISNLSGGGGGGGTPTFTFPPASEFTLANMIDNFQAANDRITYGVSATASGFYAVLLPAADITNALATTLPSYSLNLFLDGIQDFAGGDPNGLINAVGDPLAVTAAMLTMGGGLEALAVLDAVTAIPGNFSAN
ncbi:PE-PPE domain-containing protein [Mycobacterium sp.]|uniref:PE-PPE domain-containing protein n=1 Tax=Mycobacterium sp. TaxID=1785 RepID=UPI003A8B83C8